MRAPLLLSLSVACSTLAAPPGAKAPPASATPPAKSETRRAAALIDEARALYDGLEYDKVAPLAALALMAPDITLDQKLVAYQLQGSALAIIGDPVDAERPFLLLLSVRPDFVVPEDTPPKIKSVFAKVKGEFDAVREAQEAQQRKELAATIEFDATLPAAVDGGRPVRFDVGVADPRGVVKSVRVQYRRQGETEFIGLPLRRTSSGRWVGVVSGEWTASEGGFTMEALVVVADQKGPLASLGAPVTSIPVTAGALARKLPVPVWVLGTSVGITGAVAIAASGLTAATAVQNADFHARLAAATPENPANGADIVAQQRLGESLNVAAWVSWGTAGVAAVVTGVLALFTDWNGEDLEEPPGPGPSTEGPAAAAR